MRTVLAIIAVLSAALPAAAQSTLPPILRDVGIDQNLNAQIPTDLGFKDESGRDVHLSDYFRDRPVILALVYYKCPMLCTMVLNDLTRSLNGMNLTAGKDFDILTVSFDPSETPELAAAKKRQYLREYRRPQAEAGWHFLTGPPEPIRKLTQAAGFRYTWDAKNNVFAHASGIMILTPEGKIARYFYGIDYLPADLRFSLIEASNRKIASPVDRILLYCFHYDPTTGKYSLLISRVLQIAGGISVIILASFITVMLRRESRTSNLKFEISNSK
jgi:protein SCO1